MDEDTIVFIALTIATALLFGYGLWDIRRKEACLKDWDDEAYEDYKREFPEHFK